MQTIYEQRLEKHAAKMLPLLLQRGDGALCPEGFFKSGGKPKREIWGPLLNEILHAPVVRCAMADYLSRPPAINESILARTLGHLENMHIFQRHLGKDAAAFDPARDQTHLPMRQRNQRGALDGLFAALEAEPHIILTFTHMQNFFVEYIAASREKTLTAYYVKNAGSPCHTDEAYMRLETIFGKLLSTFSHNTDLFSEIMLLQCLQVQQYQAQQEGRAPAVFTPQDFAAVDRFVSGGLLFWQQGKDCPFSKNYRLAMIAKKEVAPGRFENVSGMNLAVLHEHVRPVAKARRKELCAAMAHIRAMHQQSERKEKTCPYQEPSPR